MDKIAYVALCVVGAYLCFTHFQPFAIDLLAGAVGGAMLGIGLSSLILRD